MMKSDIEIKDIKLIKDIYTKAYSAKVIRTLECKYKTFDEFMEHKEIIKEYITDLQENIYSSDALKTLKNELVIYKNLYVIQYKRLKNKKKERKQPLREVVIEEVIDLIVNAELAQYNRFFEKHSYLVRANLKKLISVKKICSRMRNETLIEIYLSIYTANILKLKIEDGLPENPKELYPAARVMKRRFIIHSGTTNTGKTYNALLALKKADTGVYLGPLRLLAMEIQEKLLLDEVMCSLKTGEESDIVRYATHMSSTVEMADLYAIYDVAVIDECQMIADRLRGCAWTRAILGIRAEEIHLCTAPEAVDILVKIIKDCGDSCEIINYQRRTPLEYDDSLQINETDDCIDDGVHRKLSCEERFNKMDISKLQYGDAIIVFSRNDVLEMAEILRNNGVESSVIYGALPHRTRKQQLKRFIDRDTTVVVATDAIGMGLNLPIRRVIFTDTYKFDGKEYRRLHFEEIKQIAGRAGRKGMYEKGFVFSISDVEYIKTALEAEIVPIEKAYIDFDTSFIDIEYGIIEILRAWKDIQLPFDMYEKINVDRTIKLLKHLDKLCAEKGLECDKETAYRLATINFDYNDGAVFGYWIDCAEEYIRDKVKVSLPRIKTVSIKDLERAFKKLDLYYSFCRSMGYFIDTDWMDNMKRYLSDEMNYRLIKRKELF